MVLVDLLLGLVAVLVVSVVVLNVTGVLATRVVLTGSMSPVMNPGDVVVTLPVSTRTPVVGDIVTYNAQRFDGSDVAPVTHRIVAIDETGRFITKGDANPDPDVQNPSVDDVAGVVVAVVPKLGVVLQPLVLLGLLVVLVATWLAADWSRRRP
jgi:signal peptidase